MTKNYSFFDGIEEILKIAEANASKPLSGNIAPEMEKRLSNLEKAVTNWKKALLSATPKVDLTRPLTHLTPRERKLIDRWTELGLSTAAMSVALQQAYLKHSQGSLRKVGKNTKKSIQMRKRKFKGVGGNDKWKKL